MAARNDCVRGVGQAQRNLEDYDLMQTHVAGGLGLRFQMVPKEKINLRVDAAYSDFEQFQAYFSFGEAF